jgi:hypothetical protein
MSLHNNIVYNSCTTTHISETYVREIIYMGPINVSDCAGVMHNFIVHQSLIFLQKQYKEASI